MSNGNDNGDLKISMPQWAKIGFQWGFPSFLAMAMLAGLFGWVGSPMMDTLRRIEASMIYQASLSRVLCNRTSTNNSERWQCEQPWSILPDELKLEKGRREKTR